MPADCVGKQCNALDAHRTPPAVLVLQRGIIYATGSLSATTVETPSSLDSVCPMLSGFVPVFNDIYDPPPGSHYVDFQLTISPPIGLHIYGVFYRPFGPVGTSITLADAFALWTVLTEPAT